MRDKVFELNFTAFGREVMRSEGMRKALNDKAYEIKNRCGEGYNYSSKKGHSVSMAMVWAGSTEAKDDNSENNTLLREMR